jgi:transcriptional regulator with XRE-family HTH domain
MDKHDVSLQAAWRILRGLSQQEVATRLGITQSAISQLESPDSRPQKRTREKLAAIYGCRQEQISLYLPKEG